MLHVIENNVDFIRWLQAVMNEFSHMCVFGRLVLEPPAARRLGIKYKATCVMDGMVNSKSDCEHEVNFRVVLEGLRRARLVEL